MTDPAFAIDQLALAHLRMTPEEIREHALQLARVVASGDAVVVSLLDQIATWRKAFEAAETSRINCQIVTRQIASLFAAGRKREGRSLLADAAAVDIVRTKVPAMDVEHVPTEVAWPDVFNPKGSKR